jgi:uncharacterized protein (DUF1786 family)
MKVLTVDVGTGTQDIFLYHSDLDIENGFKLVVPSPTMMVFSKIKEATRVGEDVVLTGVTMGGGPSFWAARDHVQAGNTLYATPEAAKSFDDNLKIIQESGIQIIGEDEVGSLGSDVVQIELKDFDFQAISSAMGEFGVSLADLDAIAVAVFDHGAAPVDVSDRQFRFDYLKERLFPEGEKSTESTLDKLAFKRGEIPEKMTRLKAVAYSARNIEVPLVVMDTAPAAILGATLDPIVSRKSRILITNVGNFHTLAFILRDKFVEGVFEHHTGLINIQELDHMLTAFAAGHLTHEEIFEDHGHGALVSLTEPYDLDQKDFNVVVTGPRRNMMRVSNLNPYFAAPFGDMMLTGCFGLLAATAEVYPDLGAGIRSSLDTSRGQGSGKPPWEVF